MSLEIPSDFPIEPPRLSVSLAPAERLAARRQFHRSPTSLDETAKQFEGILLGQVFKQMKEATESLEVPEEEEEGQVGFGEQIQSMFWMFLAEQMSREGGVGLWKELVHQWTTERAVDPAARAAASSGLDEQA